MRNAKYLNAREYAERLRLSDNRDVQDFAEDFLDALDISEDGELPRLIDGHAKDAPDEFVTLAEKVNWLGIGSDTLNAIEEMIAEKCPEYGDMETEAIIEDMISRLRPKQEYDL